MLVEINGKTLTGNVTIRGVVDANSAPSTPKTATLTTTQSTVSMGSSSDDWTGAGSGAPFTGTKVHNGPQVGIYVANSQTDTVSIDYVQMTVTYTVAVTFLPRPGMNTSVQNIMRWLGLDRFRRRTITSRCYPEIA